MSRMFSVQRAVAAAVLTIAAAPFAVSGELPAWLMRSSAAATTASAGGQINVVERAGKSDRAEVIPTDFASRTFSITPSGMEGTSILVRVVSRKPDRPADAKPATQLQPPRKSVWPRSACEPVVSPLTEVAKQLAPGRCIT